jgi:HEAT repeat protein
MNQNSAVQEVINPAQPLRASGLVMLSGLDAEERAALAGALPGLEVDRRLQLAQRLVDLGEDDATLDFAEVFTLLLSDEDPRVRRLAIEGLWEYEERELISPLVRIFRSDPDDEVREMAALALGRYVVQNEFDAIRPRDAEQVIGALREVIGDPTEPVAVRGRAVEAAGASSEPWAAAVIRDAYQSGDRTLEVSALHAMGRNSDPNWLPGLYDEMESDDPQRRFEAAGAAGQIGDEDAVLQLGELLSDADPEVQEAAIAALGEIGGDAALRRLRAELRNSEARIRDAAQAAIAEAQAAEGLIGGGSAELLQRASDDDGDDDEDDEDD